ncbi:MAG: hypothetical protein HFG93_12065 [Dorea sp.]|nr:hypothetical protein [Dorea sp.]
MRKTKKALAMLMAAALFAGPCAAGRSMYEVHAEEMGSEEILSAQEAAEKVQEPQEAQEETDGQEQIKPEVEETRETPAVLSEESLHSAESIQNTGSSEESILKITGIALSQETQVQLNPLEVPGKFTVNVTIDDPETREIDSIKLWYCSEDTGKDYEYTAYNPTASENIYPVDINVNKYTTSGKYMLREIEVTIVADKNEVTQHLITCRYTYNSEKRVFERNLSEYDAESESWIYPEFAYTGELDFTVNGTEGDEFIPYITSIEKVTTGEIYPNTPVQFNIGYVEQGSGVKSINAYFSMEGNASKTDWYFFSASCEKELVGKGTIKVSSLDSYGREAGKYNIVSLVIEDYAGNKVSYYINEENGMLVGSRDGEESKVAVEGCSYTISPAKAYIELKSLKTAAGIDKDHLAAGNTLSIVVTVRNVASDSIRIKPDECSIAWKREDTENNKREWGYCAGEEVSINPDEEKEIIFQITPNQYSAKGKRSLDSLHFCIKSSDDVIYRSCSVREGQITMDDGMGNSICTLAYNGEADYTVTVSPTPDEEAPFIEDISVMTKDVKAPGEVKLAIKIRDEGFAKAESIRYRFADIKNSKNTFGVGKAEGNKEIKYSEADHAYICTIQIPAAIIKGTYELQYIYLYDVAENSRDYSMKEGKLTDTEGNECPTCVIEVTESDTDDDDFDGPVLTAFELLNEQETVSAGSKIQLRMKAEDASGISKVGLHYCKVAPTGALIYTSALYMEESEFVLGAEGYSLYNFSVDKYCKTGQYQLSSVTIYDDSVRKNTTGFSYQEGKLWNYSDNSTVPVNGNVKLKVTQMEDIIIVDPATENITAAIADIEKNGTVVVKGSNMGKQTLPRSFMQAVKEKEVTVIVSDSGSKSELVIQGTALGTAQEDLELSVYRDEAVKETVMINNMRDNIYYPVTVVTSDTTIPVTIRIKLDNDFRKKCGDNPVRLSRETADGSMALIQDKLKISADGYIEVVFGNGLAGGAASQMLFADGSRAEGRGGNNETIGFIVSSRAENSGDFVLGDISGDGDIAMADLMMCLHHVSGRKFLSGTQFSAADIDGDGKIAMADLMKLLHYVSGRNKELK